MDALHREIARQVQLQQFIPDVVIGVARCGLVSATHISYLLGVTDVGVISAKTCESDDVLAQKVTEPTIAMSTSPDLVEGRHVLVVDTVMASGRTLRLAAQVAAAAKPLSLRTAAIVDWPNSPYLDPSISIRYAPDYIGGSVRDWPVFPWEE
jgi:hypothetical protein